MRCNGGGAWSTARGIVTRVPVSSPSSRIGIQMCAHHIFQGFRLGLPISCPELDREALVRGRDPLHEQLNDSIILDRTVKVKIKNWCLCPTPAPCSADCPCAPACPTTPWPSSSQQDRRARTLANECWPWSSPPSSASGAVGGGTRGGQLNQPILPAVEQSGWRTEALPLRTTETADLATALSAQRSTCHCYMSVCTCGVTQGLPQVTRPKGTGKLSRGETSLLHS